MTRARLALLLTGFLLAAALPAAARAATHPRHEPARKAKAAPAFNREKLLQEAFNHFYNLEYGRALANFQEMRQHAPNDPSVWNHIAQIRLYREMYRVGALESQMYGHGDPFLETKLPPPSPQAVKAFEYDNNRALQLAEAQVAAHPNSAHAHYNVAAAWALRGTFDFVLRKAYFAALRDAMKARKQADQSRKLQPGFIDPLIIVGAQNYIAGSLPWAVRVLAAMGGYSGNKQQGIDQILTVARSGENGQTDARILLAVIYRREGWNHKVLPILQQLVHEYPRNVLFAVEQAEATEAAGIHDVALGEYEAILARAHAGAPGYNKTPLDKVWYDIGNIHRLFSRFPEAIAAYQQAAGAPGAQLRYRQAATLAAGEVYDLMGKRQQALAQYHACLALGADSPAARQAQRLLGHPYRRRH